MEENITNSSSSNSSSSDIDSVEIPLNQEGIPGSSGKDLSYNPPPNDSDHSIPEEKKWHTPPAIRTMKSDVQEFFKTTKPSLMKIIGQEVGAKQTAQEIKIHPSVKKWHLAGGIVLLLAVLGGTTFLVTHKNPPPAPLSTKATPPAPLFATESSRTIMGEPNDRVALIRLLQDSIQEQEREGTAKRILIKLRDGSGERFATLSDFFSLYRITPPETLLGQLDPSLMIFIYYGNTGARFGFAVHSRDPDRTLRDILLWESSLRHDLEPLFFGEKATSSPTNFEDRTYRNIDWRFLKLSQDKDLGIAYGIFSARNIFIMTTGRGSMETVINRLFDAH